VSEQARLLAVIPARGGTKGLPGKNIRPFVGLPLIAHSVLLAELCSEIDRCVVSTDFNEIAETAKKFGAEVPFVRPDELAQDDTPMELVVRHALSVMEDIEQREYDYVLLLEPTSPFRFPEDIASAYRRLESEPTANGIIGVSEPEFNPIWVCVTEQDGWMKKLIDDGSHYSRRQDVPIVYRINSSLYIWRSKFVRNTESAWEQNKNVLLHKIPESRAISIDTIDEFERGELMVKGGLVRPPWLKASRATEN